MDTSNFRFNQFPFQSFVLYMSIYFFAYNRVAFCTNYFSVLSVFKREL